MVGGKLGTVTSPHEPEWIDQKTKAFRKEFQGADIQFYGEPGYSVYIHADSITILEADAEPIHHETKPKPVEQPAGEGLDVTICSASCYHCGGTGSVDSGGFTPWGAGIDIPCPRNRK